MSRPTWYATWMRVADIMAQRSLCVRAKVGAVIIDANNRIVATGYNGPPAGFPHEDATCPAWCTRGRKGPNEMTMQSYTDCPALHAEANALSVCDRSVREGGSIFVTGHICFSCAKM